MLKLCLKCWFFRGGLYINHNISGVDPKSGLRGFISDPFHMVMTFIVRHGKSTLQNETSSKWF